jgi:hypothetical protein
MLISLLVWSSGCLIKLVPVLEGLFLNPLMIFGHIVKTGGHLNGIVGFAGSNGVLGSCSQISEEVEMFFDFIFAYTRAMPRNECLKIQDE